MTHIFYLRNPAKYKHHGVLCLTLFILTKVRTPKFTHITRVFLFLFFNLIVALYSLSLSLSLSSPPRFTLTHHRSASPSQSPPPYVESVTIASLSATESVTIASATDFITITLVMGCKRWFSGEEQKGDGSRPSKDGNGSSKDGRNVMMRLSPEDDANLENLIRVPVREEVERVLEKFIGKLPRSPESRSTTSLQLRFQTKLLPTFFTGRPSLS